MRVLVWADAAGAALAARVAASWLLTAFVAAERATGGGPAMPLVGAAIGLVGAALLAVAIARLVTSGA